MYIYTCIYIYIHKPHPSLSLPGRSLLVAPADQAGCRSALNSYSLSNSTTTTAVEYQLCFTATPMQGMI